MIRKSRLTIRPGPSTISTGQLPQHQQQPDQLPHLQSELELNLKNEGISRSLQRKRLLMNQQSVQPVDEKQFMIRLSDDVVAEGPWESQDSPNEGTIENASILPKVLNEQAPKARPMVKVAKLSKYLLVKKCREGSNRVQAERRAAGGLSKSIAICGTICNATNKHTEGRCELIENLALETTV